MTEVNPRGAGRHRADRERQERTALIQRRKEIGLDQYALASRVGCSQRMISAIEMGDSMPSTRLALGIAQALETTVEALFEDAA